MNNNNSEKKKYYHNKKKQHNDNDNLVKFKILKDNNNPEAIAIWGEYLKSNDENTFQLSIANIIKKENQRNTSNSKATASSSTDSVSKASNISAKEEFKIKQDNNIQIDNKKQQDNKSKALLSLLKPNPNQSIISNNSKAEVIAENKLNTSDVSEKNKGLKELMVTLQSNSNKHIEKKTNNELVKNSDSNTILPTNNIITNLPNVDQAQLLKDYDFLDTVNESLTDIKIIDQNDSKSNKIDIDNSAAKSKDDNTKVVKVYLNRITRNQPGKLTIAIYHNKKQEEIFPSNIIIRPSSNMSIYWELPNTYSNNSNIVIGLIRYGANLNMPCIIAKSISNNSSNKSKANTLNDYLPSKLSSQSNSTNNNIQGKITFHAPKSPGKYIYRLYDELNKEIACNTLATSNYFIVELDDYNCIKNLEFILDLIDNKSNIDSSTNASYVIKALIQFSGIIEGMKSYITMQSKGIYELFNKCFNIFISNMNNYITIYHKKNEKIIKNDNDNLKVENDSLKIENNDNLKNVNEKVDKIRNAQLKKIFIEFYNVLNVIMKSNNQIVNKYINKNIFNQLNIFYNNNYCFITQLFYMNSNDVLLNRLQYLTFQPSIQILNDQQVQPINQAITNQLKTVLKSIYPTNEFSIIRSKTCEFIQNSLISSGILTNDCTIVMYGSSMNNFGNNNSDIDMCVKLSSNFISNMLNDQLNEQLSLNYPLDKQIQLMEKIGEHILKLGMKNVETITSCRVPVVNFTDIKSGLDCDLTFHNILAIRNTELLRAYSYIDERVRILAYIIKYWAKIRHINSPFDGTLSSYGYILCLIHFLQTRPLPILPNLQLIPRDWNGESLDSINISTIEKEIIETADGCVCNTHFHRPTNKTLAILQSQAAYNKESIALLLTHFFYYFAYKFDYRSDIISINNGQSFASHSKSYLYNKKKLDKAEADAWSNHERLSIEDPFETWYDVGHVIKGAQMKYIRKEFMRAYTLISRSIVPITEADSLPNVVDPNILIDLICQTIDAPVFKKRLLDNELDEENDDLAD